MIRSSLRAALCVLAVLAPAARAAFPPLALKPVVLQQIHSPTNITHAGDGSGRLFVCDQPGVIFIIQGGMLLPTPFLDISSRVLIHATIPTNYSERGLLGMAFHPDYLNPTAAGYRKFFLYYSTTSNLPAGNDPVTGLVNALDHMTVLSEFQVSAGNPNVADPLSERRILAMNQPQTNHNGGQLEFGPDGFLYLGTGDGGSSNDNNSGHTGGTLANPRPTNNLGNSLDRTRLLGKILRINPLDPDGAGPAAYTIPGTNPFVGAGGGIREEIFAFGLRNPWRFCFDKRPGGTNRIFCGDVGQGEIEEINLIVSGGNYGWRYIEGTKLPAFSVGMVQPPGTLIPPIAMYAHPLVNYIPPGQTVPLPQLGLSVTGGYVYRGAAIPALVGKYVFGDYGSTSGASDGRIMGLEETALNSGVFTLTSAIPLVGSANPVVNQRILALGEDESGEIYIGMKTRGGVKDLDGGRPSGSIWKIVPPGSPVVLSAIPPELDTTIFSDGEPTTPNGNSNGAGPYLFAGFASPNGFQARRALLQFNLSSVPIGASVTSATVQLRCDKQASSDPEAGPFNLHRAAGQWGEGFSDSGYSTPGAGVPATFGDATWRLRQVQITGAVPSGIAWTVPGGDYAAAPSATTTVGLPNLSGAFYTWSSAQNAQLAADVSAWLANPAGNFGWILIGPETGGATAKRFISRENQLNPAGAPRLNLTYVLAPPPTRFDSWLTTHFPTNLVGQYVDPRGDLEGDGIFNLIEYAFGFSPLAANPVPNSGLQTTSAFSGPNTIVTITFRRDTLATDLEYYLETSGDLVGWAVLAQSLAGGVPTGPGYQSEASAGGSIRVVTARRTLPTPATQFVRLRVVQR